MNKKHKIIIYGTRECPFTQKAIEYIEQKELKFDFNDVVENFNKKEEMIDISGQHTIPVIKVNDVVIVGFDSAKIRKQICIK